MSPTLYDSKHQRRDLIDVLGRGGEGSVFGLADKNFVAKVYHEPVTQDKADKLRWMALNHDGNLLSTSAWILDTLHAQPGGKVAGFIMPRIAAKEIHELYSPKSRRVYFPTADWRFLIQTAKNLAVAFHNIQAAGHVIGDVNQGNVVVLPDGTVKLIDCDSYQIKVGNKLYPCEVGVTTHIPPELQGVSLDAVVRTQNHDNFGLAVLVFQLLFLGRHPYAGNFIGAQDQSLEDSIRDHRFAYGTGASQRRVKQPPGSLSLDALNPEFTRLFDRAFLLDPGRPTPSEWVEALNGLSTNLVQCRAEVSHHHFRALSSCPWCELEKVSHWPVFPTLTSTGSSFDLATIETLLRSAQRSNNQGELPVRQGKLPAPSPELQLIKDRVRSGLIMTLLLQTIGVIIAVSLAGPGRAFGGSVVVVGLVFAWALKINRSLHQTAYKEYTLKKKQVSTVGQSWQANAVKFVSISQGANKLDTTVAEYKQLPATRILRLKDLEQNARRHQLHSYLDRHRVTQAQISGIGYQKIQVLQSFGIESAADVERSTILRIPGFGPTYTSKLVAWRQRIEAQFVFNAATGVPKQEVQRVEHELANTRLKLETTLRNHSSTLQADNSLYLQTKTKILNQAQVLQKEVAQALSNANATSLVTLPMALLVAVSFGVPMVSLIQKSAARELIEVPAPASAIATATGNQLLYPMPSAPLANSNVASIANNMSNANVASYTDAEIALMSEDEKATKADELYRKGVALSRTNNYSEAVKVYSDALRYKPEHPKVLHELGYAYYRLKRFSSAITVLQKAVKGGSIGETQESQKILGIAYMASQHWTEAEEIYGILAGSKPSVFDYQFQLGMAAKKAGDTTTSIRALEQATQIKRKDAKAHYELADLYISTGRMSDARSEVELLKSLDTRLANEISLRLDD